MYRYRGALIALWLAVIALGVYLVCFHREATQRELKMVMSASLWGAGAAYLALTVIRGLIFVPAAPLLLVGIAVFPPWPLFLLTLAGTFCSSAAIYLFPDFLQIDKMLGPKAAGMTGRLRGLLTRRGLPVVMLWSFLPFTPTGLIAYTCGLLRIRFAKTMLGVAAGSAAYYALTIFSGHYLLRLIGLK